MKLNMAYTTLTADTQLRLSQVFAAAPLEMRPATFYSPITMTTSEVVLTPEDRLRTFEAHPEGFEYPYSATTGQTLMILRLNSPDLDRFRVELASKYGGVRSYFGKDVDYPYLFIGRGSDLNQLQRGWIANMGTILQRSTECLTLGNASVNVGEL